MKNCLGGESNLELYNVEGKRVYMYSKTLKGKGVYIYNKNSNCYIHENIYDSQGNLLTYKDSNGFSFESTYDSKGNELTYKDSNGKSRGFDEVSETIPEYTMEELVQKLGNFKIKK